MNSKLAWLHHKATKLPLSPGVYIMRDNKNKIIYIGKAKMLKNRVSQYFSSQNKHNIKVAKMVENVSDFDYILTDSEFEALVLECSLIKQYQPKYNILLKDDKGYSYVRITPKPWSRISSIKQIYDDGAKYIGPYTSSFTITQAVDEALKLFRLPQCSKKFPRDLGKSRPCLNYSIGQCCAPCAGKIKQSEYDILVEDALDFLNGDSHSVIKKLETRMYDASENLEFEKAAKIRDRIEAIKRINQKQKVVATRVDEQDVIALAQANNRACFEVFRYSNGSLYDRENFFVDEIFDDLQARAEFIMSYYSMRERIPKQITIDGDIQDLELIEKWLCQKADKKITISIPKRGEQQKLVEMCKANAMERLAQKLGQGTGRDASILAELAKILGLENPPEYIESYDISHTAGSDNVAGMVVFKNARPLKSAYRRFAIKSFEGQDDCASMKEVLTRRFNEYLKQKDTGIGFGKLPDLILLDGGPTQLSAVLEVTKNFGLDIPVFGMVKDNKHKTRAIASNGGEIQINSNRKVFTLVSSIQEEVHRFAISYHHTKHKKRSFETDLTKIEGIGKKRAMAILKHFKTISNIKNAEIDDLKLVDGMTAPSAKAVYDYFHDS